MGDKIVIKGLRVFGRHGATQYEKDTGQFFVVDVECSLDLGRAAATDSLDSAMDYHVLIEKVQKIVTADRYDLIETLGERIASSALEDPQVNSVVVRVAKPSPPIDADLESVSIEIHRGRYSGT